MCYLIDLMENADNVYRTKHYIVLQEISITNSDHCDTVFVSHDIFIKRTLGRDTVYEDFQSGKRNIEGKRLPVAMYSRKYIA